MADCYTCNQNHQCVFGICVSGTNSCNPDALNPCPTPTAMPAPTSVIRGRRKSKLLFKLRLCVQK
jgi:hypothetical protein